MRIKKITKAFLVNHGASSEEIALWDEDFECGKRGFMVKDEKVIVTQILIRKELSLGDLILPPGTVIDGIQVDKDTYKVFVRNGWWAVDGIYFVPKETPNG